MKTCLKLAKDIVLLAQQCSQAGVRVVPRVRALAREGLELAESHVVGINFRLACGLDMSSALAKVLDQELSVCSFC